MKPIRRTAALAAWMVGGVVYVWFAAVRNAERVKARKAAQRRERLSRRNVRAT